MKHAWIFAALAFVVLGNAWATTIYLKDGQVIEGVRNLKEFESVFLYESNSRSITLPKERVQRIVDEKGKVLFELRVLSMRQISQANTLPVFEFFVNNQPVARGGWHSEGKFQVLSGRLPDGQFLEYYPSGRIKREYEAKGGTLNGPCREYFASGILERESTMLNGLEDGVSKNYHQNGRLKGESTFKNGVKEGETRLYFESGALRTVMTFSKGVVEGFQQVYYETGELDTEIEFRKGIRHGVIRQFFETGNLRMTGTFREGKLEGEVVTYYESGRVRSRQHFRDGRVVTG
jgi:antitoxin component YwqK of YwqJK toxin-antitoxin module